MDDDLSVYDEFSGGGGSTRGATRVPGVWAKLAVNHWQTAVDTHAANFPGADHERADVRTLDVTKLPRAGIFWASPACPPWTDARGRKRDFDKQTVQQGVLFGEHKPDPAIRRARALMEEIPRYLTAMALRGRPVLVGVVENVVQCRLWADWDRWVREIEREGYRTCEPLLSPVDLSRWLGIEYSDMGVWLAEMVATLAGRRPALDWLIVGGESGPGARPVDEWWIGDLVDQGHAASIPVFVKQLGTAWARGHGHAGKADDPAAWPAELRVRQLPAAPAEQAAAVGGRP
jgi:hypothetical protein